MAIFQLFSHRQRQAEKAGKEDVYQYDHIPRQLRVQVTQIGLDAVGIGYRASGYSTKNENPGWVNIEKAFCRERGIYRLVEKATAVERVIEFMAGCNTEDFLDILEILCRVISLTGEIQEWTYEEAWEIKQAAAEAIAELNYRLTQAGVGYQYEDQLIRIDSQFVHAEVVKPALSMLAAAGFEGPRAEFLKAHEHFRSGDNKQAIVSAANAFESMMKAVCNQKGWHYEKGARASDLLKILKANRLWPEYLDGSFDQLLATLKSGLPEVRNNTGAHGQGAVNLTVPNYVTAYALHLAASKIVLMGEAAST